LSAGTRVQKLWTLFVGLNVTLTPASATTA